MNTKKKTTVLKIVFAIFLFVILYFAYSIGKYDAKRTDAMEVVK